MNFKSIVFLAAAALFAVPAWSQEKKDPVWPFQDYGPAMASSKEHPLAEVWQKENAAALAEAVDEDVLAGFVKCPASAEALLSKLRGAYDNDPVVLVQVAAVSQWVMEKDPCWLFFWKPSRSAGRRVWTEALLSAVPIADPDIQNERIPLQGEIPNPANPPSGCYFHERCRYCQEKCRQEVPALREVDGRMVACHFADEMHLRGFDYEQNEA